MRGGEDPPVRDEAAPAEVASVSLNADLPGPLALQGILPAHHPVQHPPAAAGWGTRIKAGVGGDVSAVCTLRAEVMDSGPWGVAAGSIQMGSEYPPCGITWGLVSKDPILDQ